MNVKEEQLICMKFCVKNGISATKTSVSSDNVEIIKEMVMSNRRITVEELVEQISISHGSYHDILCNHLKMRRVAVKVVPKFLTFE